MSSTRHITLDAGEAGAQTGSILFIGNATTLIRYAGFTILTDPNFLHRGEFARLGYGLRSRRLTNPAVEVEDLPELDMVVLSHLHGDHWDDVAEAKLSRTTPVVTTPRAADTLGGKGFATEALARWQTVRFDKGDATLRITAMPGRHGPALFSRLLPDVMGSMLEFETRGGARLLRLYITGDTLVHDTLGEIRARYDDIDLALLHLGGTRVLGVLVTMDGAQGVELIRLVQPRRAIPIHYNDYTVFKSPLREFQHAAETAGFSPRLHYLSHGESYTFGTPSRLARPA
jgi:L-ascorbate metabolism protein UlaG (beta-lactamase superfamily)